MKKILLSFAMLMAAVGAWAQIYVEQGGLRFSIDDTNKYAQVEKPESDSYSGEINIPSSVSYGGEDYPVTYIGGEAFKESAVTKVTVPGSVTHISWSAFQGCASLSEVNLSEGLQEIGSNAFQGSAVTSLTIPGTVTRVQTSAMEAMTSLTKLTFAYDTEELALDWTVLNGTNNITELVVDRYYIWGNNQSISTNSVKKVTFGEHLTTIPENACYKMSLDELNIGANITTVDVCAFSQCTLPAGYNFPFAQIKEIKENAFSLCHNLPANIDLSGVETIGYNAFSYSDVQTVKLGNSLTTFGEQAFQYCRSLTTLNIPGTIDNLQSWWFYECNKLTNVTLDYGSTALTLEDGTFSYATNLTIDRTISGTTPFSTTAVTKVALGSHMASTSAIQSLNLSQYTGLTELELLEGWTTVPSNAFKDIATVTTLTLPASLEQINEHAFDGTGLTSVTIPGTLKSMRNYCFANCSNLTSVTIEYGADPLYFGYSSFGDNNNVTDFIMNRDLDLGYTLDYQQVPNAKNVTVGPHVTFIPKNMFKGLTGLESLTIGNSVTEIGNYAFQNCAMPSGATIPFAQFKKIGDHAFEGCTNIPATLNLSAVEEIGGNAFKNCTSIENLTIGGGTIGSNAFNGCTNLSSITLNEGVTEIGGGNFSGLTNLATISLPSTLKKIGGEAFRGDVNLTIPGGLPNGLEEIGIRAFYDCKKLNVAIPSAVTSIGQSAFHNCESLTEVNIPAGVTSLGMYTFGGCIGLTSITIPGTLMSMNNGEFGGCTNLREVRIEYGETPLSIHKACFSNAPCTNVYIDRNYTWNESGYSSFSGFRNTENIEFGSHVTTIPDKALYQSSSLTNVTMTDNVTSIGEKAFYGAKVNGLNLSKNIQTIGQEAFYNASFNNSFTFPISVNAIGDVSFYSNSLKDVYVPWLTPLGLEDDSSSWTIGRFSYGSDQTLWVPGGTMDAYQDATVWKKFKNFDYWSFVVTADVAGKGQLDLANGEEVTDNGTNTALSLTGAKLVGEGAGEAVRGLFVREKDLTLTPTPARGYELTALTANGEAITPVEGVYKVANLLADQEIHAEFSPIIYTITYNNLQNGVLPAGYPETYTVETETFSLPHPERTAYNFLGWTGTDLEGTVLDVTIEKNSIGDREYTAVWEPIVYPITYDLADGAVASANPVEYTIETPDFTLTNPTKLGYTFTGWEGTDLTEKTLEVTVATGNWGNRSYTATWEPNPYKVHFDINGGDGTETMADQNFVYDAAQNLTANAFTRTGYTFKEWNSKADGTGTVYADGQSVLNLTAVRDEVVTMYAQWTPNPYQVAFNANNGEGTMANQNFTYDVEQALAENAFTRTGYTFKEWNTAADGSAVSYADKASVKNLTAELNGVVDVYAQWEVIPYTIDYDLAGGSVATDNPAGYNIETPDFTLTNPTRKGYDFAGWTGTGLSEATTTVTIAKGNYGDRTYTATWTPIVYNITYDLAGGSVTGNPATYTIETPTFTLNNPTKAHWVFTGWTGTDLSAATMTVQIAVGNTGDRSYTATWERETYTVSIESNLAGMVTASTTSPKYEDDVVLTIADDEDYDLLSLTVDGVDVTSQISGGQYIIANVQANVTVVATYNANKAFITMAHSQQTFSCTQPLDFTDTGLKAYIASGFNNGVVLLTRVDVVPANTGLFLVGTEGQEYKVPFTDSKSFYSNLLKPVTTAQVIPTTEGEYTNYLYGEVNGEKGFYKSSGSGTVAAGKAYLQLPTAAVSGARVSISFDDNETTGISSMEVTSTSAVYNLQGHKVADEFNPKRLPQGVYIVNGKKVVVKK